MLFNQAYMKYLFKLLAFSVGLAFGNKANMPES